MRWLIGIAAALVTLAGGYLVFLNPDPVTIHLAADRTVTAPLAKALLIAFGAGALVVGLLAAARGITSAWRTRSARRAERRAVENAAATTRARELVWTGHFAEARATLLARGAEPPTDTAHLALLAETYLEEADPAAARRLLERGITENGADVRLLDLLASAAEAMDDPRGAIDALERARLLQPESPRLARRLRDLHAAAGRWHDALALEQQLLLHVRSPAALANEQRMLRGLRYQTALGEPDARLSARALRVLAREDPDFLPAWVGAGDQLLRVGRRFAARRIWERAARRRPSTVLLERLAALHTDAGNPARATRFLRRLQRRHPTAPAVPLALARHLVSQGDVTEAAAVLDALPEPLANEPSLVRLRAELYRRAGDQERAVAAFGRVANDDGAFECTVCRRRSAAWQGQCAECRRWNTLATSADLPADR